MLASAHDPRLVNGVIDALSELGIKNLPTPLTPMKVWQAIHAAKPAHAGKGEGGSKKAVRRKRK